MGNLLYLVPEEAPVWQPTYLPTLVPVAAPTMVPVATLSPVLSLEPSTRLPTLLPTASPSERPSVVPSLHPSHRPTASPSHTASVEPTGDPIEIPENVGFRYITEQTCTVQESGDIQDHLDEMAEELRRRRELFFGKGICFFVCAGYPVGTCFQFHLSCYIYRRQLAEMTDTSLLSVDLNHRPDKEHSASEISEQIVVPASGHSYGRKMQTVEECQLYNTYAAGILNSVVSNVTLTPSCIAGLQHAQIDCFPV